MGRDAEVPGEVLIITGPAAAGKATVATVATRSARTEDLLRFAPVRARFVRVILLSRSVAPLKATKNDANPPLTTPILDELTLPAP